MDQFYHRPTSLSVSPMTSPSCRSRQLDVSPSLADLRSCPNRPVSCIKSRDVNPTMEDDMDYMAQMGDTRTRTEDNYQKSVLTEDERKFFGGLSQVRYVLMLAENWCGDVHRNSPLIAHIAEAMPNCEQIG